MVMFPKKFEETAQETHEILLFR